MEGRPIADRPLSGAYPSNEREHAMKITVVYHSQTGNTKKLAEAMADTLGIKALSVAEAGKLQGVDLLFLGDGVYMGGMAHEMRAFIESLDGKEIKAAAVFGTFGGQRTAIEGMKKALASRGIAVVKESFGCKGQCWFFINRKQPNAEQLNEAQDFVRRTVAATT
jgi:flavodoxin